MFNLIVTIISIALIAVLAVASIYYGGDAFRSGSAKAAAAQLVNGAQQVSGANVLYANDNGGANAPNLTALTTDGAYLASAPQVPSGVTALTLAGGIISAQDLSDEVCAKVVEQSGDVAPAWSADLAGTASAMTTSFTCVDNSGTNTFIFK